MNQSSRTSARSKSERGANNLSSFHSLSAVEHGHNVLARAVDDGDLPFTAHTDETVLAVGRKREPINRPRQCDPRGLAIVSAGHLVHVHQVMLDIAGPYLLLVGPNAQTMTAAPFTAPLLRNEMLDGFCNSALRDICRLEAQHVVDVLEEEPLVAGDGR